MSRGNSVCMNMKYALLALGLTLSLSGCQAMWCGSRCGSENRASTSLVGFLYPSGHRPPTENVIPQLNLPVRVGLAFLPTPPGMDAAGLEAARREALLERIRQRFASRKFVREIVIVPDYYLRGNGPQALAGPPGLYAAGGFDSLAGVQRLYGLDVIALVSYDQVTYRDDNTWSLGYMTIVGAYLLKGTRHDVATLMDLAVVDPQSRSILLRAGGTDERHGRTTLVAQSLESRQSQTDGFSEATDALIGNFDAALTQFEADVKSGKANVRVANRSGTRGGGAGAFGITSLLLLGLTLAAARVRTLMRERWQARSPLG